MGDEKEIMDEENGGCSCFAVKIPRLDDEVGKEQIRVAELHLDDKTSCREAIRLQIQTRIENDEYKHASDQLKSARDLVRLKRKEIDSHLSVLRLVKNTLSFHDNFQQQLEAQLHLKTLKKELESLKASVVEAESAAAVAAQRKNHDQEAKQLEARLRDANDACQAAYAHLRYLRTQHRDKMRHFLGYRNEATAATKYAARSRVKCDRLCKNQVERFMIMWNKNSMFRQDYVNSNATSTVRRFGTLDGRSLGPDEQPHTLPRHVDVPVVIPEENEQGISGNDVSNEAEAEAELKLELVEADKPQIGPELKAQMEAEKREKKRHKRLRLKERKKAAATGDHHHQMEEKIQQVSEKGSSEASPLSDNLLLQQEEPEKDVEVTTQAEETRRNLQQQGDVVEVTMHAEETKGEEGEDGLKEGVQQLQGQTEGDQRQQVTNEKRRQKRLRKKERNKAAREGRSAVDRTETPELTDHHHEQTYVGSNPEMQSNADDENRDQNQQVMSQETPEPANYATLTRDHDPNEEQQEEATVHDPKEDEEEQQEEVTIHDPKEEEEEEEQQQQEEATIHDPKEEEEEEEEVTIHDPKEEEEEEEQQHEQEEEVTIHDPKEEEEEEQQQQHEQEEEVTIHDPKEEEEEEEEEEEQQQEEEVTMQVEDTEVIEQLREALMAQMRAEIKAQLEAEIRDKKREKRLRKKGRNKERKEAAANGKAFIWMTIFIIVTLILCLTYFRFNLTTIHWS